MQHPNDCQNIQHIVTILQRKLTNQLMSILLEINQCNRTRNTQPIYLTRHKFADTCLRFTSLKIHRQSSLRNLILKKLHEGSFWGIFWDLIFKGN